MLRNPVRRTFGAHVLAFWASLLAIAGCGAPPNDTFQPNPGVVSDHNRAIALMGKFDYAEAHTLFRKLTDEYPNWQSAKVDLAIATLNRQQPGDDNVAATILAEVMENEPDNLRAKYCRAILYLYASEPNPALDLFRAVAEADPTDAYAMYYTGQCHFQLAQYEEALRYFLRAQEIDSYLRSAYYGAFQASQQLDNMDQAQAQFEHFQRLEDNPQARLAEIKYTRMGPKAEVRTIAPQPKRIAQPSGPLFSQAKTISIRFDASQPWRTNEATTVGDQKSLPAITVCDINHDGTLDYFICGAFDTKFPNAVLIGSGDEYDLLPEHPLASVQSVNAALWGDIDNDGRTDVYLCRSGPNQLWKQTADNGWSNITEASQTSGGDVVTIDGACFDADHDGDLDLFLVNEGPNELLNNNLDGTFRKLASEHGIAGNGHSHGIVLGDFDSDRDVDLLIVNEKPPHEVYRNDRLWNYEEADGFDAIRVTNIWSAISADTNADGRTEIFAAGPDGVIHWTREAVQGGTDDRWSSNAIPIGHELAPGPIAVQDVTGDGQADIVVTTNDGWATYSLDGRMIQEGNADGNWSLVATTAGYSIIASRNSDPPTINAPGPGRLPVTLLSFSGKENKAEQMRSNASGIGVQASVRIGSHWTTANTFRTQSGRGQSLQPVAVGLRGEEKADFVSVRWPDGVFQSEIDLQAGRHLITETQRQVSSCPVVFAWDGNKHQFVTDVLGVGGIGFNHGRGEYHPPRPWENLLLPDNLLTPMDGEYIIKLCEPMEEVMYLDAARLVAYDLPPGWDLVLDERLATNPPHPTGEALFYRKVHLPTNAFNTDSVEVTQLIRQSDGVAVEPGKMDRRFLGRTQPHELVLEFDLALDNIEKPVLVFDGWVEYPYSQTMFAAWQARAAYDSLTLEARDTKGNWQVIYEKFGYIAGMPRRSALPIDVRRLPAQTKALRLSCNLELYFDFIQIVEAEACQKARRTEMKLNSATVAEVGFPRRVNNHQKKPSYDYSKRVPLWDTRHLRGSYSEFGTALAQVTEVDDESSIVGPGEEIELNFIATPLTRGKRRRFVLETNGWCKDRDLFTQFSETVEPIPSRQGTKKKTETDGLNLRYRG